MSQVSSKNNVGSSSNQLGSFSDLGPYSNMVEGGGASQGSHKSPQIRSGKGQSIKARNASSNALVGPKKDETDQKIERLQNINHKLMNKMKELNLVLENTLDRANTRKMAKISKETGAGKPDVNHQIKIK